MSDEARQPLAVILGCAGERLTPEERRFFAEANPLGFVLFRRNCVDRDQVRALVSDMRGSVGRDDAPILIDQEGGRVARLQPPQWRRYPSAGRIGALPDPQAEEAARLGARLIAEDLWELGITADAAPVLDLPADGADPVIGDRAYGSEPARVTALGRAVCEGLLAGGVLPIIKHIPGHGRARVDSHRALPRVEASRSELAAWDFAPFRALSGMPGLAPWAMTAHIVFAAIDDTAPATLSRRVVQEAIRGDIGFDGVLVSDDISMGALAGSLRERTRQALAAGCDLVLHCNGELDEMIEVAEVATPLTAEAQARIGRAKALRQSARRELDRDGVIRRFDELVGSAALAGADPTAGRA